MSVERFRSEDFVRITWSATAGFKRHNWIKGYAAYMRGLHSYVDVRTSGLAADDLAPEFDWLVNREIETKPKVDEKSIGGTHISWASKRAVDIGSALLAFPFLSMVAMAIAILTPPFTPGTLLFISQDHQ